MSGEMAMAKLLKDLQEAQAARNKARSQMAGAQERNRRLRKLLLAAKLEIGRLKEKAKPAPDRHADAA